MLTRDDRETSAEYAYIARTTLITAYALASADTSGCGVETAVRTSAPRITTKPLLNDTFTRPRQIAVISIRQGSWLTGCTEMEAEESG